MPAVTAIGSALALGEALHPASLVGMLAPPAVRARRRRRARAALRAPARRPGRRLTLVACPAGFGKSTLLAAWRESELQRRPVAWVTLDEGDDDAVVLWSHVVEALCRACPALDHARCALRAAPLREVVLPRLVNALAELGEVALVLDDFHRLSSASRARASRGSSAHLPATVQLVISTRTDPALPLGTLRARGQLLELRADELRFTAAEADEFLNGRLGLELAPDDVELLVARTEGWPAGIYLAALSLAGTEDRHALVAAFDGTSAHVVDFLASEVLAAHPPELQRFMLRTSVLERLCAPLCDAVPGRAGLRRRRSTRSRARTSSCSRSTTAAAGSASTTCSPRSCASSSSGASRSSCRELHRRAYEWHRESARPTRRSTTPSPAGAFAEAGAADRARRGCTTPTPGRTESVLDWLGARPRPVDGDPRLLLVKAWVVGAARPRGATCAPPPPRRARWAASTTARCPTASSRSSRACACSSATFGWGDVSAILAHGDALGGARAAGLAVAARDHVGARLGALLQRRPRRGRALAARDDADRARRSDQWIVGVAAIADLSLIAGHARRRDEQLRLAQEAVELTREVGLLDAVEDGEVHTAYGVALAAHGRSEEALPALEKGVFLRRLWAQTLDLIDG